MKTIAIIGCGAIAEFASAHWLKQPDIGIAFVVIKRGLEARARELFGADVDVRYDLDGETPETDLIIDCAGHSGLRQHGERALALGTDLLSVSSGALADDDFRNRLIAAAQRGGSQLRLVSGAIGGLDALAAGSIGKLRRVTYRGRKPPRGWAGSPAEDKLELASLTEAAVHFSGSARNAALEYPRNANVAASVALAGVGFDDTRVELVADPAISRNIHEVDAEGDFGRFEFRIEGDALPSNPRSSAIAAMSVVRETLNRVSPLII